MVGLSGTTAFRAIFVRRSPFPALAGTRGQFLMSERGLRIAIRAREKASREVLLLGGFGEVLDERPVRLVFLFLGGFLLGCHELYPSVRTILSPKVLDKAP